MIAANAVDEDDPAVAVARPQREDLAVRGRLVPANRGLAVGELDRDQIAGEFPLADIGVFLFIALVTPQNLGPIGAPGSYLRGQIRLRRRNWAAMPSSRNPKLRSNCLPEVATWGSAIHAERMG
jgi:hypothetical protein